MFQKESFLDAWPQKMMTWLSDALDIWVSSWAQQEQKFQEVGILILISKGSENYPTRTFKIIHTILYSVGRRFNSYRYKTSCFIYGEQISFPNLLNQWKCFWRLCE